ncbi:MAG: DUF4331 domain-containing protein [Verrucomicrobiales bacterium]|nr:DUF4331 domain-containing protein [Verrucomicrobiales bacterium]
MKRKFAPALLSQTLCLTAALSAVASSHREAPQITASPKLDCTDFYMFGSYEAGRPDYVTLVANYLPLQDAYGGPNFFQLDDQAIYEIHIDNNGDAVEDLTFQFRFTNTSRDIALAIGPAGNQRTNAVPVLAVGQIGAGNIGALNVDQTYRLTLVKGPRRTGESIAINNPQNNGPDFTKPQDNVGNKTIPDYDTYANSYIYEVSLPGTAKKGKVFVGQRKDPFVVNLGETFDLVNISTSPLGPENANRDTLADKNVTALCLELPAEFLRSGAEAPIIGAWTTASRVDHDAAGAEKPVQMSRLSMPLVNEVVIGLKDKNKFNASEPKDDLQFADYVTHPTLPAILELLYGAAGVKAPTQFPRNDLLAVFVTGVDGLNKNGAIGEMQRLNTSIAPVPRDQQKNMGVLAGDNAGFPNGRRPGDDVVDMALRVVMGVLLPAEVAPSGKLPFTDGATVNASMFLDRFPYLTAPIAGSPNDPTVIITPQVAPTVSGPYKSVPGTFDPATRTLSVDKPSDNTSAGFLRAKSDRQVTLSNPGTTATQLKAVVK